MRTFEVLQGRTWRVWIDGEESVKEWSIGESEQGARGEIRWDTDGLQVGGTRISEVSCAVDFEKSNHGDHMPKTLNVYTNVGNHTLTVTRFTMGDADKKVRVQLRNGRKITVDDTQIYIRAERIGK